jgi:hypothetical protein
MATDLPPAAHPRTKNSGAIPSMLHLSCYLSAINHHELISLSRTPQSPRRSRPYTMLRTKSQTSHQVVREKAENMNHKPLKIKSFLSYVPVIWVVETLYVKKLGNCTHRLTLLWQLQTLLRRRKKFAHRMLLEQRIGKWHFRRPRKRWEGAINRDVSDVRMGDIWN